MNAGDFFALSWPRAGVKGGSLSMEQRSQRIAGENASSFGSQLRAARDAAPAVQNTGACTNRITIRLPDENCLYSGGRAGRRGMQDIYVAYTEDSTSEDPVVRISGTADSGKFDFTCHINEIDPTRASYAEMTALFAHLSRKGVYQASPGNVNGWTATPPGLNFEYCDLTQKQNFIQGLNALAVSDRYGPGNRIAARDLLKLYQGFLEGKFAN